MKCSMVNHLILGGILVSIFSHVNQVSTQTIVNGPSDIAVLEGGTVQLTCELSQPLDGSKNLRWSQLSPNLNGETLGGFYIVGETGEPILLFPIDQKPQLDRYSINITGNNYDLVIEDADVQVDDAQYNCWVDSQPTTGAQLTVAVRATDPVIVDPDTSEEYREGETVKTSEEETLSLRCETTNGRPKTDFYWYRGNEEINCNNSMCNQTTDKGDGTFDSSSLLNFQPTAYDNGISLNCSGEQNVGPIGRLPIRTIILDVLHAPLVEVVFDVKQLIIDCQTVANPSEIDSYRWLINGTEKFEYQDYSSLKNPKELAVDIQFSCIAANTFGSGSGSLVIGAYIEPDLGASTSSLSSGAIAGIVIVMIVVVVVVIVAVLLVKRQGKGKKKGSSNTEVENSTVDNTDIEKAGVETNDGQGGKDEREEQGEEPGEEPSEDPINTFNQPEVVEDQDKRETEA